MRTSARFFTALASTLLASSLLTACGPAATNSGGGGTKTNTSGSVTYKFEQPTLDAVTAESASPVIGDTMTVLGTNFIDPAHGTLGLYFKGSFTDQNGNQTRTPGLQLPLRYSSAGQATFALGPDNPFGPPGTIGTFNGDFQVYNTLAVAATNGEIGDMQVSDAQAQVVNIGPSIFLDELRSVDAAKFGSPCEGATPGTTGSQNIRLSVHYVGMNDATSDDPVFYTVNYDSTQLTAAYVSNQDYSTWPFWGPSTPNAQATIATGQGAFSYSIMNGNSVTFDPQAFQQVVAVSPAVTFNQQQTSQAKLAGLATLDVPAGITQPIMFTVRAQHQNSGTTINRTVSWTVRGSVAFGQPTPTVLSSWETAQIVPASNGIAITKGSIPNGTNMSYSTNASDTKQKSINMSWNVNNSSSINAQVAATIGIFGNDVQLTGGYTQSWAQTFGTDLSTSDAVTTGTGSNTSVQVNPGMFGAFYLQWGDKTSSVHVTLNDACGNSTDVGVATLTEHIGYLAAETSTQNPPPCPIDDNDCHPAGPAN